MGRSQGCGRGCQVCGCCSTRLCRNRRSWGSDLREEDWLAWAGKRDPPLLRLADQGRAGAVTGRVGAGREEQQRARHSHS